jgi:excisionase family DNA binding protein
MEKITASIEETSQALGLCRATVYNLIKQNRLETRKVGTRRLVVVASIHEMLENAA